MPPQQHLAPVLANDEIIAGHKVLVCEAPAIAQAARPGHFVNALTAERTDPLLRKPFSIYTVDRERGQISLLYSIVGATTQGMARKQPGDMLDIVGPLGGHLFVPDTRLGAAHIMVGGGYGVPPLVFLSRELQIAHPLSIPLDLVFIIGARRKDLLLCEAELVAAGVDARAATEDGSHGTQGRVTDVLEPLLQEREGKPVTVYCCGPTPMMKAVGELCMRLGVPCQLSVEVAMPCGIGVCMGCVLDLTDGRRVRCCVDGPVFEASEVAW
jgi:dihydroorotate dehydrogenase electron transfer subunit